MTDVDVEWADGSTWHPAASIANASAQTIALPFQTPVKTDRIRVTIRREIYEGQDRQYADVESIRVLDAAGRNWAVANVRPIAVQGTTAEFSAAFPAPLTVAAWAASVEPTEAEVMARFERPMRRRRSRVTGWPRSGHLRGHE